MEPGNEGSTINKVVKFFTGETAAAPAAAPAAAGGGGAAAGSNAGSNAAAKPANGNASGNSNASAKPSNGNAKKGDTIINISTVVPGANVKGNVKLAPNANANVKVVPANANANVKVVAANTPVPAPPAENAPEESDTEEPEKAEANAEVEEKPKPKRAKREPKPTDSKSFFKARAKEVAKFGFTSEGDLRVPSLGGEEAKTIPLPFYSPATPEELGEIDAKRRETIKEVETEYDELCRQLATALEEWKRSGDFTDAVRLQRDLLALDSRRTSLRSPLRWGKVLKNPTIKSIQMHETAVVDEKQKDLKLGYDVMSMIGRPYTFEQTILPRKEAPKPKAAEPEAEAETEREETFILFDSPADPEYGILSPETPVDFVFNTTKYTSLLQAYHVERVTRIGRTDLRATLLKLVNPKTIRGTASRVVSKELDMPLELVTEIVKSLVLQDARYTPVLTKTGTDSLIYAEPADKVLGTGVSMDDENATNSKTWPGQNLLGQAWEAARKSLPTETVQKGGALESGKTIHEGKEERSKVLMGYYRRKA